MYIYMLFPLSPIHKFMACRFDIVPFSGLSGGKHETHARTPCFFAQRKFFISAVFKLCEPRRRSATEQERFTSSA